MGKKDKKKKDPEKKAAIQAKKEAKAEKKELKRLNKELKNQKKDGKDTDDKDDFDSILQSYNNEQNKVGQEKKTGPETPIIEVLSWGNNATNADGHNNNQLQNGGLPFPLPRANFSFTYIPTSNDFFMFGGEYYNGVENMVFDTVYRYDPDPTNSRSSVDDDGVKVDSNNMSSLQGEWKRITCPSPSPQPRCAHSAVYYNNYVYVFGGEFATASQFHHYKDFWRYNLQQNLWEEILSSSGKKLKCPSPRSGHRCIVWRHYMILYGGFYEALKDTRWFDDLWVFDMRSNKWDEIKYSNLATKPEARSAFTFGLCGDIAYLYGGFSKLKNPGKTDETKVHTDCWALHLKGLEKGNSPSWERLKRRGDYPSPPKSAMGSTVYKSKLLLLGGVSDTEKDGHKIESIFYQNMYSFDMENKRWFTLNLKKKKDGSRRKTKSKDDAVQSVRNNVDDDDEEEEEEEEEEDSEELNSGWGLDMLRSNMFAFIDGDGNIVYEKIEEDKDEQDEEKDETKKAVESEKLDDGYTAETESEVKGNELKEEPKEEKSTKDTNILDTPQSQPLPMMSQTGISSSQVMKLDPNGNPTAIETPIPLPRMNPCLSIKGNTLYLYGGILEVGDREITLDDLWTLDLQKRHEWVCIWRGTMHRQVWKGIDSDLDEESYISTDKDGQGFQLDSDEEDDEDDYYDEDLGLNMDEKQKQEEKEERRKKKSEAKKAAKKSLKDDIKSMREKLGLEDENRTPKLGESMADFYARTSEYWMDQVMKNSQSESGQEQLSHKELKREGFQLAKSRYEELSPTLERLEELENIQKEAEQEKQAKKERKKGKYSSGKKEKKEKKRNPK